MSVRMESAHLSELLVHGALKLLVHGALSCEYLPDVGKDGVGPLVYVVIRDELIEPLQPRLPVSLRELPDTQPLWCQYLYFCTTQVAHQLTKPRFTN